MNVEEFSRRIKGRRCNFNYNLARSALNMKFQLKNSNIFNRIEIGGDTFGFEDVYISDRVMSFKKMLSYF